MKQNKLFLVLILLFITLTSFIENTKKEHVATWYNMHGRISASGVRMHKDSATCAYNALPFGTKLLVTNLSNNKQTVVTVTDRMGLKTKNRIDLSYKAFGLIANHKQGKIKVSIRKIK
jgi:rare lipoprotein A